MLFNPFAVGVSNFMNQTSAFINMQNEWLKSVTHLIPKVPTSEMTVLHPDPRDVGQWQRNVFITPPNSDKKLLDSLTYYTFIPTMAKDAQQSKVRGLVVMLHGCEQNASVFAQGSQINVFAQKFGFMVLYPEQSKKNNLAQCWRWFSLTEDAGIAETNTIIELIDHIAENYKIHPSRKFVAGMSAGAGMATALAFSFPDKFAAVALHSGPAFAQAHSISSGLDVMSGMYAISNDELLTHLGGFAKPKVHNIPTLIIHGVKDRRVNISNAEALTKQALYLNKLPLNTKPVVTRHEEETINAYTQKIYYSKNKQALVKLIEVDNMGHEWAGGDTSLPFNGDIGPNSSEMILRFFYQHATPSNELK
ncbi:hypothetical protein AAEX37_01161 [Oligella sp. MSHR50489EDL]|uniref:extracellular catalytic domain type 1 short-chain-length polyhydroxyalkanoate depolymerase n=1 Tax=Oligella sp. MSHR50489EDL TaxID=3139409 RepID=UPI003D81919B